MRFPSDCIGHLISVNKAEWLTIIITSIRLPADGTTVAKKRRRAAASAPRNSPGAGDSTMR
ncbi:hypothetical protein L249_2354 [Ophiocordyceps polyrhachis-furcata BCC 54312]|uniref:Uncharacterized protein n=1 Tax=Ophiocordyceps polyrhachis-furcata BCC 54312 TaxID=1330021 RepID=A0A367LP02_9HYPO|nr:hypothetical protein L249_2354 [Ophiocordyceps polyrhachis-furcata BCC 54312]